MVAAAVVVVTMVVVVTSGGESDACSHDDGNDCDDGGEDDGGGGDVIIGGGGDDGGGVPRSSLGLPGGKEFGTTELERGGVESGERERIKNKYQESSLVFLILLVDAKGQV